MVYLRNSLNTPPKMTYYHTYQSVAEKYHSPIVASQPPSYYQIIASKSLSTITIFLVGLMQGLFDVLCVV